MVRQRKIVFANPITNYPISAELYIEMVRTRENKTTVVRRVLAEYFGISQAGKLSTDVTKYVDDAIETEAANTGKTKIQVVQDILNEYLERRSTEVEFRPAEDVDREIEERLGVKNRKIILARRLSLGSTTFLNDALEKRAQATGKPREEIERDLLCSHFNIKRLK